MKSYPLVKFSKNNSDNFFRILNKRVNEYFKTNGLKKTGDYRLYIKTGVMLSLFILPYLATLLIGMPIWTLFIMYAIMGMGVAGIGLCIMHDSLHGSFAKNPKINQLFSLSMNLIGGSAFTWKVQHNYLHHTFTNVKHLDEDIDDKPFIRLSPTGKLKKYHRFQHIYAFFLYSLATVSWLLFKDFKQLKQYNKSGITDEHGKGVMQETSLMILSKSLFVFFLLVLPVIVGLPFWVVICGFLLMQVIAGFYITVVFQLAHVVEGPEHHDAIDEPVLPTDWAVHQMKTTANFATNNKFVTWMVGGLNHQIEHHLFPNICHVHYGKISKIVKSTAKEFNVPYHEFKRVGAAIASHARVLKMLGNNTYQVQHA